MLTDKAFSRSPKSVDNADLFAQAAEKSGKGGLVCLRKDQQEFIALNAELSQQWPSITRRKPAPDDADQWRGVKGKIQFLKR